MDVSQHTHSWPAICHIHLQTPNKIINLSRSNWCVGGSAGVSRTPAEQCGPPEKSAMGEDKRVQAYCNNNAQCAVTQRWMPMDRHNHNCTEAKTLENSSTVTSGISLFCLDQNSVHFELNIKWEFRVLWNRVITSNVPERNSWIWKRKQVRQIVWAHAPVMVRSQDSSLSRAGS